jgi:hypothetical protein
MTHKPEIKGSNPTEMTENGANLKYGETETDISKLARQEL